MNKKNNIKDWSISHGDYQSEADYKKAFGTVKLKDKIFNFIMLTLFAAFGFSIILFSSILISRI